MDYTHGRDPDANKKRVVKTELFRRGNFYGVHARNADLRPMPLALSQLAERKDSSRNQGQYLTVGQRIRELYYSVLQYRDEDETQWHFRRLLGYGSFGVAALYERREPEWAASVGANPVTDQLVVKSEAVDGRNAVNPIRIDIAVEAWNLAQLMERKQESNVRLRDYKFHQGDYSVLGGRFPPSEVERFSPPFFKEWRYYLEYCSLDTIYHLMLKYKAWGYYLPEAFIWWTFFWLTYSCQSMDVNNEHPFRDDQDQEMADSFMLHNDMSWRNVFMQKSEDDVVHHGPPVDQYPMPKMADFGLSQITRIDHERNRMRDLNPGTAVFMPPEKRRVRPALEFYPFTGPGAYPIRNNLLTRMPYLDKRYHPVGPEANLWGAATIVYLLMTLNNIDEVDRILEDEFQDHDRLKRSRMPGRDRRRSSAGLFMMNEIDTHLPSIARYSADYSDELQELVLQCMRLRPHDRPRLSDVLQATSDGMNKEISRLYHEFDDNAATVQEVTRVQYLDEEWNQTPRGPFNFGIDLVPNPVSGVSSQDAQYFWHDFHQYCDNAAMRDPDAVVLVPPEPNTRFSDAVHEGQHWVGNDWVFYAPTSWRGQVHQGEPLPAGGRIFVPNKNSALLREVLEQEGMDPETAAPLFL
ncbi:hypothetical protein LTS08_007927 [Lithohypha guttulata]|nr:hypothetical protein LTS08_007927 [Lithohypha guttulata]